MRRMIGICALSMVAFVLAGCASSGRAERRSALEQTCAPPAVGVLSSSVDKKRRLKIGGQPPFDLYFGKVECAQPPLPDGTAITTSYECTLGSNATQWSCPIAWTRLSMQFDDYPQQQVYVPTAAHAQAVASAVRCLVSASASNPSLAELRKSFAHLRNKMTLTEGIIQADGAAKISASIAGMDCTTIVVEPNCDTAEPDKVVRSVAELSTCITLEMITSH